MSNARVLKQGNEWAVFDGQRLIMDGLTNATAWRLADKHNLEAINRQQDVSDWIAKKNAD